MNQFYRILLVEDEAIDAELNKREIKKALPFCTFEIVDNKMEYLLRIETFIPDIIISDFNMPSFDGLSALKIAQELCPHTPFIMVTGSINEDTAVECMKSGASDYVLKDSLKRLGSSVVNALEQSKIRKERLEAFETIKLNEAKYRYMFHNNPQPMWIYDVETLDFLEVNETAIRHYGYSQKEFLSMKLKDILTDEDSYNQLERLHASGHKSNKAYEFTHKKKNGDVISVETLSHAIIFNQRNARHVLINDITERKKAEAALRVSEERFRTLLDNVSNISVQGYSPDGTVKYWNKASEALYQYTRDEAMGKNLLDLIIPVNMREGVKNAIQFMIDQGHGNPAEELILQKKDGSEVPVYSNHSIIQIPGKEKELFCIDVDLTARKEAEEKLIQERKLLRVLIDNLPATIYIKDAECRKMIANRADLDIAGVKSEAEILGKTDIECYNNEIGLRGYLDDKKVIETGEAILNREEDFYDINGNLRWLLTSKIPLTDENGKISGLVGIGRDITEQKLAQEKILRLSKGIEQSPVSIEITDVNGIIEYVNPRFCETTGYSADEIIGKYSHTLKPDQISPEIYNDLWETIKSGGVWRNELIHKRKDGSTFWESVTSTSIKNESGVITNYIVLKENISERKQMEAELIQAKEKAEESDKLKSAFLANMSHEIRTPLNSIIGFSELLGDVDFNQEQKSEFIQAIVENGNSLLSIISDIMDFSMLEAHQMKVRIENFSTKKLLSDLRNDFNKKATQKGIEFHTTQPTDNEDTILESDLYRIKQVFNNLIGNSLKFTKEGHIEVGYAANEHEVIFHVKDTGIGIAPEHHQSIFERFRQIDLAKTRRYGGNGLGLSISKNLIELLGGKIWVESVPEKYSNFFFSIPTKNNAK
jgi:PAS domain S-box-containing protein